jgi:hypothetical protein
MAANNVYRMILSSFTELMVLNGLSTLSERNPCKFTEDEPPIIYGNNEDYTMMKSNTFQASLKYAPLLNMNPSATIFRHISVV